MAGTTKIFTVQKWTLSIGNNDRRRIKYVVVFIAKDTMLDESRLECSNLDVKGFGEEYQRYSSYYSKATLTENYECRKNEM